MRYLPRFWLLASNSRVQVAWFWRLSGLGFFPQKYTCRNIPILLQGQRCTSMSSGTETDLGKRLTYVNTCSLVSRRSTLSNSVQWISPENDQPWVIYQYTYLPSRIGTLSCFVQFCTNFSWTGTPSLQPFTQGQRYMQITASTCYTFLRGWSDTVFNNLAVPLHSKFSCCLSHILYHKNVPPSQIPIQTTIHKTGILSCLWLPSPYLGMLQSCHFFLSFYSCLVLITVYPLR